MDFVKELKRHRFTERVLTWIAWKLPRPLLYWAVVRAGVYTEPSGYPGDVTVIRMLKKLEYR